jgi:hypothetical protein
MATPLRALLTVLFVLFAAASLSACGRALVPGTHQNHVAGQRGTSAPAIAAVRISPVAVQAAAAPELPVNLPSVLNAAERFPWEVAALRRTIAYGALGLLLVGMLNAGLLFAILRTLERRRENPVGEAIVPVEHAPRRCSCGVTVSDRSRTGRCRRCALAHTRETAAKVAKLPRAS